MTVQETLPFRHQLVSGTTRFTYDNLCVLILFQSLAGAAKRLIPMFDRILVQRAEAITKTKGGIVLPEKSQGKVLHGTVIAVGPGSRNSVSFSNYLQ